MNELLREISKIACVNGGERRYSQFLKEYFTSKGFFVQRLPGNHVFVQRRKSSATTVIFTPMDSPGFICLYKEGENAYLSPTSKALSDIKDFDFVVGSEGIPYKIEESKYDKKSFCIKSNSAKIGEIFSVESSVQSSDNEFIGRFSSKLACIFLLIKLADLLQSSDVALCFTAGYHSGTRSEANVLKRIGASNAVFVNFAECDDSVSAPILAIKDGKHFSSKSLSDRFMTSCKQISITVEAAVFDQAITSAERSYAPQVGEILSLALPCSKPYTVSEKVWGIDAMLQALTHFLNSNF